MYDNASAGGALIDYQLSVGVGGGRGYCLVRAGQSIIHNVGT